MGHLRLSLLLISPLLPKLIKSKAEAESVNKWDKLMFLFTILFNLRIMKKILFLVALILSTTAFAQNHLNLAVGENVIDFSLKTVNSESVNLNELLKSNPVILVVLRGWPGYQCPICTKQVGDLISSATEFEKHHVSILMVYPGPSKELTEHAKEFKQDFQFPANYYFAVDPDYSMINLYGLRWEANRETAYPSTFVINKDGKIVYSRISHSHGDRSNAGEIVDALNKL